MSHDNNDTSSISFTAHYTGYVWHHYGLSDAHFATGRGKLFFTLLRPFERIARCLIGSDIKTTLLQRHFLIDRELEALIVAHPGLQVLEIACGLSPRGHRFTRRHAGLCYVEADLPGMVARKRRLLEQIGSLSSEHRVIVCNILDRGTPDSLEEVIAREFDPARPLVVITEGLVNYFDLATISPVWQRLAAALRTFPAGTYLSDIYPEIGRHRFAGAVHAANRALKVASRSSFTLHFRDDEVMRSHFMQCDFTAVTVFNPDREKTAAPAARGGAIVRVLKAAAGS